MSINPGVFLQDCDVCEHHPLMLCNGAAGKKTAFDATRNPAKTATSAFCCVLDRPKMFRAAPRLSIQGHG
jgi:hypothetical protein